MSRTHAGRELAHGGEPARAARRAGASGRARASGRAPAPRIRALLAALAVLAGALLAGCGIPLDPGPVPLPTGQLPAALKPSPTTQPAKPSTTPVTPCGGRCVDVYFTSGTNGLLVPNVRYLSQPLDELGLVGSLQATLNALVAGPTVSEASSGLSTWLSFPKPLPQLTVPGVRDGVATIVLDNLTTETSIYQYENALGQIVWTLAGTTTFPSVKAVKFEYAGTPYPAILPNGEVRLVPVTRRDFREMAPASS